MCMMQWTLEAWLYCVVDESLKLSGIQQLNKCLAKTLLLSTSYTDFSFSEMNPAVTEGEEVHAFQFLVGGC